MSDVYKRQYIVCAPAATAVNDKSAVNIAFLISIVINGYLLPPLLLEMCIRDRSVKDGIYRKAISTGAERNR